MHTLSFRVSLEVGAAGGPSSVRIEKRCNARTPPYLVGGVGSHPPLVLVHLGLGFIASDLRDRRKGCTRVKKAAGGRKWGGGGQMTQGTGVQLDWPYLLAVVVVPDVPGLVRQEPQATPTH